jgi:hypothetical protein
MPRKLYSSSWYPAAVMGLSGDLSNTKVSYLTTTFVSIWNISLAITSRKILYTHTHTHTHIYIYICVCVSPILQSTKALRESRGIALLRFLDLGTRRGWGGQRHAPAALYTPERPGTHCAWGWVGPRAGLDRCGKSHPHRDSIPGPSSP